MSFKSRKIVTFPIQFSFPPIPWSKAKIKRKSEKSQN